MPVVVWKCFIYLHQTCIDTISKINNKIDFMLLNKLLFIITPTFSTVSLCSCRFIIAML